MPQEDRRREIKQAALQVFAERGYQAATVGHIVARAGVAQGTFYLYFPNKKAAFLELIGDFADRIETSFDLFEQAIAPVGIGPDQIAKVLEQGYRRYLELCRSNLDLARLFFQESVFADEDFRAVRQDVYTRFARRAKHNLDRGKKLGLVRVKNTEMAAHCVVGMIERLTTEWLLVRKNWRIGALARELANFETFGTMGHVT